ncbi:LysE family translocator [Schumannella luteola]|uniref:Threonine/homoserine/homoserine lactone efflux protein n=1 Tax=Schumannella luteola TaxID=472059 RepID=A0A852Y984_9MICO|nr:LysE family translocator [Schumannella luteola]NYG97781.1 threonine/homoserine/homoserine lactone efflux protein [Schumannella luteola]TPW90670.1 LysE family translocator [Schumannella luteola]
MPASDHLAAFALAALVLIVIPGPSVLFVIGRSLVHGRTGGALSVLGNGIGVLPLVFAVAFGLGAVITASEIAFTVIKIIGAGYLMYLGVQAIRHRKAPIDGAAEATRVSRRRLIGHGIVVGATNPKTIVFLAAALPQFVDVGRGDVPIQMLVFGAIFVSIGLASDLVWALLAGTARNWFARSPRRLATIRGTGGVMTIGLGGVLLGTGAKH